LSTPVVVGGLSSFDGDGFTLDFNGAPFTTDASSFIVNYIAFGGSDFEAEVGDTLASASPVTGLAFQPDLVFTGTTGYATNNAGDENGIGVSFGAFNSTDGWWDMRTGGVGDYNERDSRIRTSGCTGEVFNQGVTWEATSCTTTSDGFSWTGSDADRFFYLALDLPTGVLNEIGTFTKTTAAAPVTQTLPELGFTPEIYGLATGSKTGEGVGTAQGVGWSHGAYDGTTQNTVLVAGANSGSDLDMINIGASILAIDDNGATPDARAEAQLITDSTPDIIWQTNNADADIIGYWAIGYPDPTLVSLDDAATIDDVIQATVIVPPPPTLVSTKVGSFSTPPTTTGVDKPSVEIIRTASFR